MDLGSFCHNLMMVNLQVLTSWSGQMNLWVHNLRQSGSVALNGFSTQSELKLKGSKGEFEKVCDD